MTYRVTAVFELYLLSVGLDLYGEARKSESFDFPTNCLFVWQPREINRFILMTARENKGTLLKKKLISVCGTAMHCSGWAALVEVLAHSFTFLMLSPLYELFAFYALSVGISKHESGVQLAWVVKYSQYGKTKQYQNFWIF